MKKLLPFLFLIVSIQFVSGQITTSTVKANFGVEADLRSNYYNVAPLAGVDDWFNNGDAGAGVFIIDTTGAAAIVSAYTSAPATRTTSFSRPMNQVPYSVFNNKLLLDALFTRDFHGNDSTVFASGSNKNGMTPAIWSCPISQGVPDKNDILDAFTHIRRDGPTPTDSLWMFGGLSIENTTGNRYFDFELFQTNLVYNRSTQNFSGYGPDAGHTSWTFDAAGNIVTPGDIIFTEEFSSSSLTLVEARIWVNRSDLSITPTAFDWGGVFDGDGMGAVYGYANILPKTAGEFYTGIQNAATTWAGPFALVRADNSVVTDYLPGQFMEFSVNLTKLGIDPATYSSNACAKPFRSVLIKTRASTSFTAELKDFIAPFKLFDYPQVQANAYVKYFCGTMPSTTIEVTNPLATSTYTWTTTDGNIVGSTTDSMVTINAPGTYYVAQQMHSVCPSLAIDSVAILFDSVCTILNVGITKFSVNSNGLDATISWQANNNELGANYVIEHSIDNRVFNKLVVIPANEKSGMADYSFRELLNSDEPAAIYYRIGIIGKNGVTKYSNTILFHPGKAMVRNTPLIFPNPAQGGGGVWMSLQSAEKTVISIYVFDMSGRIIKILKIPVKKGNNLIQINELAKLTGGMYIVKVKSIDGETTQKLLLQK